ncbi:hypothetical protein C0416_02405 [bacterium]|nr:hypothetical protein [bacterium]
MNDDKNLTHEEQKEAPILLNAPDNPLLPEQKDVEGITSDSQQKVSDVVSSLSEPVKLTDEDRQFLLDLDNQNSSIKKKENADRLLKLIRGEAPEDKFAPTIEKLEQHTKQFLAKNKEKSSDFYLPSYAIWRLFKKGNLEKYGISDKAFAREFSCNNYEFCPNFVHAYKDKEGKFLIKGWFKEEDLSAMDLPEELVEAIKQEMDNIVEEIAI